MGGLRKSDILRGRGAFTTVRTLGKRFNGTLLRVYVRTEPSEVPRTVAGFAVSHKLCNAVWRNRLRRLMREAYLREKEILATRSSERGLDLQIVFQYVGADGISYRSLSLNDVHDDLARLCGWVVKRL